MLADTLKFPNTREGERHGRIDDMLTHYREAQESPPSGHLGDGEGVVLMPAVWSMSGYPVLEALLRKLRAAFEAEETWPPYWHIREWYFRVRWVQRPVWDLDKQGRPRRDREGQQVQRVHQGALQFRRQPMRYEGVPAEVERQGEPQVRRGLRWVSDSWPETARYEPESVQEIVERLDRARKAA